MLAPSSAVLHGAAASSTSAEAAEKSSAVTPTYGGRPDPLRCSVWKHRLLICTALFRWGAPGLNKNLPAEKDTISMVRASTRQSALCPVEKASHGEPVGTRAA